MKWIFIVILACVCIGIGYMFSTKYSKRAKIFKALVMLCQKLDVEINFSRERLKNLISNLDDSLKKDLFGLDENYVSFLTGEGELTNETLFKKITFLKVEEKELILLFFKSLGRSDLDSQSKEIKNYESRFENFSSSSTSENKKYGGLSIKLGIVSALMVLVMLC